MSEQNPREQSTPIESLALERYRQAFEMWRFASGIRFKIMAAWWAVYIGLAVVFAWMWKQDTFHSIAFLVPMLGVVATLLFWAMDQRNGGAIHGSRDVIGKIEASQKDLPCEQRIIPATDYGCVKHRTAIGVFAVMMIVVLLAIAFYSYKR